MSGEAPVAALLGRLRDRSARVGIIGLGYVGLPLARAFIARHARLLVDTRNVTAGLAPGGARVVRA